MTDEDKIKGGSLEFEFKEKGLDSIEKRVEKFTSLINGFSKSMERAAKISTFNSFMDDERAELGSGKPNFEALKAKAAEKARLEEELTRLQRQRAGGAVEMMAASMDTPNPKVVEIHTRTDNARMGRKEKEKIKDLKPQFKDAAKYMNDASFTNQIVSSAGKWRNAIVDGATDSEATLKDKWKSIEKGFEEQNFWLDFTSKNWKILTGAVIGSFYTIAKLSPLFASYMSEFGGILGYFYDTILIPFTPLIEGLLDILWKITDWVDSMPKSIQILIGLVAIGIPLVVGFVTGLVALEKVMLFLGSSRVVAGLLTSTGGIVKLATLAGPILILTGALVSLGLVYETITNWGDMNWADKILMIIADLIAIMLTVEAVAKFVFGKSILTAIWASISAMLAGEGACLSLAAAWGVLVSIAETVIAGITAIVAALGGWVVVIVAIVVVIALIALHWSGLDKTIIDSVKGWIKGIKEWYSDLKTEIENSGGLWAWFKEKVADFAESSKTKLEEIGQKVRDSKAYQWAKEKWDAIGNYLSEKWTGIKESASNTWVSIKEAFAWDNIKQKTITAWDDIKEALGTSWDSLYNMGVVAWDNLESYILNKWNSITNRINTTEWIQKVLDYAESTVGSVRGTRQTGGPITQDGIYYLHQGEHVIPSTMNPKESTQTFNITISPVINVGNGSNPKDISYEISKIVTQEIKKIVGGSLR